MSYLLSKKPTDDFTRKLDNLVNTIKSNKQFRKGYDNMGAVWYMDAKREGKLEGIALGEKRGISIGKQQGISIGKQQGISIGALQKAMDAAKKLLATGLSKEQISSCLDLPIEKIEQLSKQADK